VTKANPKFIWYPKDDGTGVVPAFLEGNSPKASPLAPYDNVRFYLYTQRSQNTAFELLLNNPTNLVNSGFNKQLPVKIMIHGFSSNYNGGSAAHMKNAYLNNHNVNLVAVQWGTLAAAPWYETAAGHTRVVGQKTAELITYLIAQGVSMSQMHVLGHSLGAHAAGFAGAALSGRLPRITALDPALPLFGHGQTDDSGRIDPTDAVFVDVIHSAGGTLLDGGLAFREARGHADFYPNEGEHQPGCGADAFGACSHSRCYEYYGEALANPRGFRSCKCTSWDHYLGNCACTETDYIGDVTNHSSRGLYYLRTNSRSPFAMG